ncbi:hypothetical protein CCP3SC15_60003 [Gammaproteobacteria bacterium]
MRTCYSKKELLREIVLNFKTSTIIIIGEAGTGKTRDILPAAREQIEKFLNIPTVLLPFRVQAIDATDISGIPYRADEGFLDYVPPQEIKRIFDAPEVFHILFMDEVNRAERDMKPNLFKLFENMFKNGIFKENVCVIGAINIGDDYDTIIDFGDKALASRIVFIKYVPSKTDALAYMVEHAYEPIIIDVVAMLPELLDYPTKDEYEIPTTFRSYYKWDNRLKTIRKLDNQEPTVDAIIDDFIISGQEYFNNKIMHLILNKLHDIKNLIKVDLLNDVIIPATIPEKYKPLEQELLLRTKEFYIKNLKEKNLYPYINNMFKLMARNKELIVAMLREIMAKDKKSAQSLIKAIDLKNETILEVKETIIGILKS